MSGDGLEPEDARAVFKNVSIDMVLLNLNSLGVFRFGVTGRSGRPGSFLHPCYTHDYARRILLEKQGL